MTFGDLWWCLPDCFTNWDEFWYVGKFYVYTFDQMHKLTFDDLWLPLVAFTLLFDQLRWKLLCTCSMYTIFTKYTNWTFVTFSDHWWCIPELFTIWDEIWYIGKCYVYKFNQVHKLTFGDIWWPLDVLVCTYFYV